MGDRRSVLKRITIGLGGAVAAAMAWPVLRYILYPAGRITVDSGKGLIPVADAGAVPPGSKPVRVQVIAPSERDAWSKRSDVPLGAAWLVREPDGTLKAFTTTCPHLGCAVNYLPQKKEFLCPCHGSSFALDGHRLGGPAKRGMDPLKVVVKDGKIKIRFQRFQEDTAQRRVLARLGRLLRGRRPV